MKSRILSLAVGAAAATSVVLATASSSGAATPPPHHTITCDSASFYAHYAVGSGPFDLIRTLYKGNDVGHDPNEAEINGWAYSLDYGPNDWGYVEMSCLS